jgi:hypothetical protein
MASMASMASVICRPSDGPPAAVLVAPRRRVSSLFKTKVPHRPLRAAPMRACSDISATRHQPRPSGHHRSPLTRLGQGAPSLSARQKLVPSLTYRSSRRPFGRSRPGLRSTNSERSMRPACASTTRRFLAYVRDSIANTATPPERSRSIVGTASLRIFSEDKPMKKRLLTVDQELSRMRAFAATFPSRQRALRVGWSLTLRDVCVRVGTAPSALSEIERGLAKPTTALAERISGFYSRVLGERVSYAWFSSPIGSAVPMHREAA